MTVTPTIGPTMDELLAAVWQAGGTDILLTVGTPPQMRVNGSLWPVPGLPVLTANDVEGLLAELYPDVRSVDLKARHEYDFSGLLAGLSG
jgi:twitching motility protein PilT